MLQSGVEKTVRWTVFREMSDAIIANTDFFDNAYKVIKQDLLCKSQYCIMNILYRQVVLKVDFHTYKEVTY